MLDMASGATVAVDNFVNTIGPLADAIGPYVGPTVATALPWLTTALVVALPICVAIWPVMYRIAAIIPGTLDTWLLDRIGALLERLAQWILRKPVKLVESGDIEAHADLPKTEAELSAGLTQEQIEEAKKEAGL